MTDADFQDRCADILTMRRFEALLKELFQRRAGKWSSLKEICDTTIATTSDIPDNWFVTWLEDASGNTDYSIVVFYDDDAYQSFAGQYNHRRLLSP